MGTFCYSKVITSCLLSSVCCFFGYTLIFSTCLFSSISCFPGSLLVFSTCLFGSVSCFLGGLLGCQNLLGHECHILGKIWVCSRLAWWLRRDLWWLAINCGILLNIFIIGHVVCLWLTGFYEVWVDSIVAVGTDGLLVTEAKEVWGCWCEKLRPCEVRFWCSSLSCRCWSILEVDLVLEIVFWTWLRIRLKIPVRCPVEFWAAWLSWWACLSARCWWLRCWCRRLK